MFFSAGRPDAEAHDGVAPPRTPRADHTHTPAPLARLSGSTYHETLEVSRAWTALRHLRSLPGPRHATNRDVESQTRAFDAHQTRSSALRPLFLPLPMSPGSLSALAPAGSCCGLLGLLAGLSQMFAEVNHGNTLSVWAPSARRGCKPASPSERPGRPPRPPAPHAGHRPSKGLCRRPEPPLSRASRAGTRRSAASCGRGTWAPP